MDDAPPGALALMDRQQMLPLEDAPRNGLQLANGNVQLSLVQRPAMGTPANPPSVPALPPAMVTPQPYANMSPLQDQEQDRAARGSQEIVSYGPSRSVRSARRALEYNTSPDKETVKRELEEQRIETRRLSEELQQAAQYNENQRNLFHRQTEDALRHQQQEFENSQADYVRMNETVVRLRQREYEAELEQQTQEVGLCRDAVRREMAVVQNARQFEATQAQFEQHAQRFCQQAADSEHHANDILNAVIDQGKQLHREFTTVMQHEQHQSIILSEAAEQERQMTS